MGVPTGFAGGEQRRGEHVPAKKTTGWVGDAWRPRGGGFQTKQWRWETRSEQGGHLREGGGPPAEPSGTAGPTSRGGELPLNGGLLQGRQRVFFFWGVHSLGRETAGTGQLGGGIFFPSRVGVDAEKNLLNKQTNLQGGQNDVGQLGLGAGPRRNRNRVLFSLLPGRVHGCGEVSWGGIGGFKTKTEKNSSASIPWWDGGGKGWTGLANNFKS